MLMDHYNHFLMNRIHFAGAGESRKTASVHFIAFLSGIETMIRAPCLLYYQGTYFLSPSFHASLFSQSFEYRWNQAISSCEITESTFVIHDFTIIISSKSSFTKNNNIGLAHILLVIDDFHRSDPKILFDQFLRRILATLLYQTLRSTSDLQLLLYFVQLLVQILNIVQYVLLLQFKWKFKIQL